MRLTFKTDQAQTPPILVNTACLYPDNTHTHTTRSELFTVYSVWKSITENCDWAEMGIASEAQKMPVWLQ